VNQLGHRVDERNGSEQAKLRVQVPEPIYLWLVQIAVEDNVTLSAVVRRIFSIAKREGIR
jgi:hypothetical protein